MFSRILSKLFFSLSILSFLYSGDSNFWNTFVKNSEEEKVESQFSPFDFTVINSSNLWGETEPCG